MEVGAKALPIETMLDNMNKKQLIVVLNAIVSAQKLELAGTHTSQR